MSQVSYVFRLLARIVLLIFANVLTVITKWEIALLRFLLRVVEKLKDKKAPDDQN